MVIVVLLAMAESVERRKIWLIGLDQVTVSGADNIQKVLNSGDVERMTSPSRDLSALPFWARCFFPVTRFYSSQYGWFLPLISDADAAYPPCRRFLDQKFEKRGFLDEDVSAAADLLEAEEPASDDALIKVFVQAIYRYFSPGKPIPAAVLKAANKQLNTPVESFLPWRRWPSASGTDTVYSHASDSRKDIPGAESLPDKCVVDLAHVCFSSAIACHSQFLRIGITGLNRRVHARHHKFARCSAAALATHRADFHAQENLPGRWIDVSPTILNLRGP